MDKKKCYLPTNVEFPLFVPTCIIDHPIKKGTFQPILLLSRKKIRLITVFQLICYSSFEWKLYLYVVNTVIFTGFEKNCYFL
jgi:hypothetical protein